MSRPIKVAIIDDEPDKINSLKNLLEIDPHMKVESLYDNGNVFHEILENSFDCIIVRNNNHQVNTLELDKKVNSIYTKPIIYYNGDNTAKNPNKSSMTRQIKDIIEKNKKTSETTSFIHSEHPKVVVEGNELWIIYRDGRKTYWGIEKIEPENVAKRMGAELKAINHVKKRLERFVSGLALNLIDEGICCDRIPEIIYEGYFSLLLEFKKLESCCGRNYPA